MVLQGGRRFSQTIRVPSHGEGGTFIVAEKVFFSVPLALFTVYAARGKGVAENVRILLYGGGGLKLLTKTVICYLNVPLRICLCSTTIT